MKVVTKQDIRNWINGAKKEGATHMLVVCDTFDYEDYPVSVMPDENVKEKYEQYNDKNMQKVMEVYNLSLDIESQINQVRAMNF
jgi:hypothetical protein